MWLFGSNVTEYTAAAYIPLIFDACLWNNMFFFGFFWLTCFFFPSVFPVLFNYLIPPVLFFAVLLSSLSHYESLYLPYLVLSLLFISVPLSVFPPSVASAVPVCNLLMAVRKTLLFGTHTSSHCCFSAEEWGVGCLKATGNSRST